MAIQKLPPLLISQIAAGEVIERPASVVKELVENSLDAGATRIEIALQDGGRQMIRVTDNACGIPSDQLELAVTPHATSKLSSSEQLTLIHTMGFRGEALASIASVSRIRLTSRAQTDGKTAEAGATLEVSGDVISEASPTGCAPGTTVEVRDLFFNTPARRKFMRAASTEFGHIADVINRIGMAQPQVSFRLLHGVRTVIDAVATPSRRQRCVQLLGAELDEAMLTFEASDSQNRADGGPMVIWGLAGIPSIARATSKFQYLYVNGRWIRDRNISHAIKEAYRGLIPPNKHPHAVVMIDSDPQMVDVNVHPAKTEVRFHDRNRVHGLVLSAIRQRLLATDLTPSATLSVELPRASKHRPDRVDRPATVQSPQNITALAGGKSSDAPPSNTTISQPAAGIQRGFDLDQIKRAVADPLSRSPESTDDDDANTSEPTSEKRDDDAISIHNLPGQQVPFSPSLPSSPPVLQVHDTYLVTQDDQGLIIVDQHALHERVMFEELRVRLLDESGQPNKNLESQRLLMPAVVKASPAQLALLEQLKPLMNHIGIEVDPMGPDTVAIHAFPSFLFDRNVDPIQFVEDLLDRAEEGDLNPLPATKDANQNRPTVHIQEAVLHKVIDMMACKAAVKAGDQLNQREMTTLLAKRHQIERASACPHGRPTSIRLTLQDMEKQFKRR